MSRLFYVSQNPHAPGDHLGGGNFGRGYRAYYLNIASQQQALNGWKIASEYVIESVREKRYPDRPSRLTCSYAYNDEDLARRCNPNWRIYEVEPVNASARTHVAAFNLMSSDVRYSPLEPFIPYIERIADDYWAGRRITIPEVLVDSLLRVVKEL